MNLKGQAPSPIIIATPIPAAFSANILPIIQAVFISTPVLLDSAYTQNTDLHIPKQIIAIIGSNTPQAVRIPGMPLLVP